MHRISTDRVEYRDGSSDSGQGATVVSLAEHRRLREPQPPPLAESPPGLLDEVATRLGDAVGTLRRRIAGDFRVDEFGYDEQVTEAMLLPLLRPVYDRWFRVEVEGLDNVPDTGAALIVANHAGVVAWDGLMLQLAVHDKHRLQRHVRLLGADLVFHTPVLDMAARAIGATPANPETAARLLANGELAAVFPEGFKGCGKSFTQRYQLQRFGRGGFASTAIRAGVPIVPCSIVGAEETYPKLADIGPLAKLLGLPYFPLTPLFPHFGPVGLVPLPTKWRIRFGEPIPTTGYAAAAADDPVAKSTLADQVRDTIQVTLDDMVAQRGNVFLG